jgi:hypothetical protein
MVMDGRHHSTNHPANEGGSGDLRQVLLREVNERIEQLNRKWESDGEDGILCECGDPGCTEKIAIPSAAYERVRGFPTYFLVKPGHETAGSERIIERADGYLVVEKIGHAARTAIQLNPRRRTRTKASVSDRSS